MVHCYDDKTPGAWTNFIATMNNDQQFECDQEMFYYWLEVLPPCYMSRTVKLPDGSTRKVQFGFAEGPEQIVAFWIEGSESDGTARYFGCRTNEINKSR